MTALTGAPVVVGIDGSPRSLDAVEVAAAEAALRARPLRIVHALQWPTIPVPVTPGVTPPRDGALRARAETFLDEAVRAATKAAPEVTVTAEIVTGAPVPVLLGETRRADLLVLGDRGLGQFTGLLVGSVAVQAATHGHCPVLVVRGTAHPSGPVVVGVDGSEVSTRAIGFAAEEATRRGAALVAVHAWHTPPVTMPGDMMPLVYDPDLLAAMEERVLLQAIAGLRERYPDLALHHEMASGPAGRVLTERSHDAQLIVVGDRGHGGFVGLLLGSVSQHLIYHADCPVAVVRGEHDRD
ncbi:universal stress protein [Jidongwangia harbinensis]|uniref:universal stress protein n=1 Tax=Jidongwangia harbinensis TaxID=2878561 RepID=UPI001CDA4633|nr:universal stress protein [Jidongwangia harbinensis]MCA2218726.1 universal stress protein [Jidongwangia harbinensis]